MTAPFDLFSPFKYFNVAPVTDWERFINPQFNVTFNQADAAVENRVLAVAGSYGRQIGRCFSNVNAAYHVDEHVLSACGYPAVPMQ